MSESAANPPPPGLPSAVPSNQPPFQLDRRALSRAFDRAADSYDVAAILQGRVRAELLERLQFFDLAPGALLDLGAGTCRTALALQQRFARARIIAVDLAAGMLRRLPRSGSSHWWPHHWPRWWSRRRIARLCADAVALPLKSGCIDLVVSNLMLQWCDQPDAVFTEVQRVLRPGGLFVFSTFGPETLHELREAFAHADGGEHVSRFADLQALGDGLVRAGLREPVMDIDQHRIHYADARTLMRELQHIGATHAASGRARGLMGRARMQRMLEAYERRREPRGLPATYEVIFGTAFGSGTAGRDMSGGSATWTGAQAGEVRVPVDSLRSRRRA
jgi:malonyl-CoA O-methyltransferase